MAISIRNQPSYQSPNHLDAIALNTIIPQHSGACSLAPPNQLLLARCSFQSAGNWLPFVAQWNPKYDRNCGQNIIQVVEGPKRMLYLALTTRGTTC